jgi:hypothetical protein
MPATEWDKVDRLEDLTAAVELYVNLIRPPPHEIPSRTRRAGDTSAQCLPSRRLSAINCAALSDEPSRPKFFGHTRGAFTGGSTERAGLSEEADGGTLFLGKVGELTARAQARFSDGLSQRCRPARTSKGDAAGRQTFTPR